MHRVDRLRSRRGEHHDPSLPNRAGVSCEMNRICRECARGGAGDRKRHDDGIPHSSILRPREGELLRCSFSHLPGRGDAMADFTRRDILKVSSALALGPLAACVARPMPIRAPYASAIPTHDAGPIVNDVHSQLNATRVDAIVKPLAVADVQQAIADARTAGKSVSIAGGRHAMGGQQFGEAAVLLDTRDLNRVLAFDDEHGSITVEGGIQWPELLDYINRDGLL